MNQLNLLAATALKIKSEVIMVLMILYLQTWQITFTVQKNCTTAK